MAYSAYGEIIGINTALTDADNPVDEGICNAIVNNIEHLGDVYGQSIANWCNFNGDLVNNLLGSGWVTASDLSLVTPIGGLYYPLAPPFKYYARIRPDGLAYPIRVRIAGRQISSSGTTCTIAVVVGSSVADLNAALVEASSPRRITTTMTTDVTPGWRDTNTARADGNSSKKFLLEPQRNVVNAATRVLATYNGPGSTLPAGIRVCELYIGVFAGTTEAAGTNTWCTGLVTHEFVGA